MPQTPEHIISLWERYLSDKATMDEVEELFLLLKDPLYDTLNYDCVKKAEENLYHRGIIPVNVPQDMVQSILQGHTARRKMPVIRRWYWAAASIIMLLGLSIYFYDTDKKPEAPVTAIHKVNDISAPLTNRASITLGDGSTVYLDSVGNGQLALQGDVKLVKLANGQIAYINEDGTTSPSPGVPMATRRREVNTLTNPRGSRVIDMTLADGSRVWLNAGSSVTYPVAFIDNERKVTITGEAYFEVASSASLPTTGVGKRPFIVVANGVQTEVLGTHFNVNAYQDEPDVKVTLLEGSVKVSNNQSAMLKPGQQASGAAGSGGIKVMAADINKVMAWRANLFNFDGMFLKEAMRQLERWYDIDVVYENGVQDIELMGKMTRGITLNGLMIVLQQLGVHYKLEGRKLIIEP
ncbi:MAG: FecR domain-containing protein [Niabella sp.]